MEPKHEPAFEVEFYDGTVTRHTVDNLLSELSKEGRLAKSIKIIDYGKEKA